MKRSSAMGVSFASRIILGSFAVAGVLTFAAGASAQLGQLRPAQGGEVRALVIGIDAYQFVPPLRGAVADARDLETTLRGNAVKDAPAVLHMPADLVSVMLAVDLLVARSGPRHLVVLTIAGHGV